ncbi:hypothetical protein MSIBF_A1340008 [groundwater metagenome]|uniref:Uncharacterized protein n=1 Tax=groundwater metagenome TaxID=717931 RepID=A0A098E617_9ZZZZ
MIRINMNMLNKEWRLLVYFLTVISDLPFNIEQVHKYYSQQDVRELPKMNPCYCDNI